MLIIMLNFIIAIVDRSYTKINGEKRIHVYWVKAELNQECYQLMKYWKKLEEYRVLVFSTCKDYEEEFIGVEENEYDHFVSSFSINFKENIRMAK